MENQNYQPVNLPQSQPAQPPASNTPPPEAPQVQKPHGGTPKPKSGIIAVVAFLLLVIGGAAYAFFFTDLKYKIPWLRPDESELVNLMYDRLAEMDGADFSIEYSLGVADRDEDLKGEREVRVSQREARSRSYSIDRALDNVNKAFVSCVNKDDSVLKNLCSGDKFKPKAGDTVCSGSFAVWPDLSEEDWEFQDDCKYHDDDGVYTWAYSAKANYNGDVINCSMSGCVVDRETSNLDYDTSEALMFAAGDYFQEILEEFEEQIPQNFSAKMEFSGKGFSLADRLEGKKYLPDLEVGLKG